MISEAYEKPHKSERTEKVKNLLVIYEKKRKVQISKILFIKIKYCNMVCIYERIKDLTNNRVR